MMPVLRLSKVVSAPPAQPHPHVAIRHYEGWPDAGRWLQLQQAALGSIRRGRPWTEADFRRQWLRQSWWRADRLLLAHRHQHPEAVVGAVGYRPQVEPPSHTAHLLWLAVRPGWQRQGVGRLLVEQVERQCDAAGLRRLMLETLASWEAAIDFYQALGFGVDG